MKIKRVFREKGREYTDPAPNKTPEEALATLARTNAKFTNAKLEGPIHEGEVDVYKIESASGYGRKG